MTSLFFCGKAYNKVKHKRTSAVCIDDVIKVSYKFATLEYTLHSLSALYQILIYMFYKLAKEENARFLTPIPGSMLFELKGRMWDDIDFYENNAFYIDEDGHLYWMNAIYP